MFIHRNNLIASWHGLLEEDNNRGTYSSEQDSSHTTCNQLLFQRWITIHFLHIFVFLSDPALRPTLQ